MNFPIWKVPLNIVGNDVLLVFNARVIPIRFHIHGNPAIARDAAFQLLLPYQNLLAPNVLIIVIFSLSSVQGCCQCAPMGIPSNRRSAVEPEKRGRIVYQAAKAGTDHHHSVSPRLSKLIKQAQIRAAPAAKPKDDRLIFMLNL